MAEIDINGAKRRIRTTSARSQNQKPSLSIAGVGQAGARDHGSEGVFVSSDYYRNDIVGKTYPGRVNFPTQRMLAYNSTVVKSILTLRSHQVAKLPFTVIPKDKDEPPKQTSILEYSVYNIEHHPAFDEHEVEFLIKVYTRLDPKGYIADKKELYEAMPEEFTSLEHSTIKFLQKKHEEFYRKRTRDIKEIKKLLSSPDPWFTQTKTWENMLKKILNDMLVIDRGILIKIRDEDGKLKGLMPVDGTTVRPLINEYGFVDPTKAFVQVINGSPQVYLRQEDVIILSAYPMADIKYFGYGFSPMETLYTTVLSDIFIDKGNLDYYRKGGSIPEGFISIEPPPSREGMISQIDQEQLESIQRHLQSIMMGDYTQVPIISGGKVSWIDFKGKRKDMQFRELAEYLTRKICAVYQVSPQDVGIISDVNRSTSQTQAEMTKSKGLETIMRVISEYLTTEVLAELREENDLRLWFEDDDVEKERERWMISQQKIVSGVLTINQYRAQEGLHPVPWGNTPLQGLRNWKPEEEEGGGMPGMPNLGNLPPLPGMPSPENPGGPMGGDNPMAGGPPQPPQGPSPVGSPSNLKSSRFFSMNAANEDEAHELMIKGFSSMYEDESNYHDMLKLYDINNYPGGQFLRTPIDSYEMFSKNAGITIHKSVDVDSADPIIFSRYVGSGQVIVDENGEEPLIKSITKGIKETLSDEKRQKISEVIGNPMQMEEAIERAIYKSLDAPLQNYLYEDFYKFQPNYLTDAQVEKVGEYLEL
jgi:phage portal protein BeeE